MIQLYQHVLGEIIIILYHIIDNSQSSYVNFDTLACSQISASFFYHCSIASPLLDTQRSLVVHIVVVYLWVFSKLDFKLCSL